MALSHYARRQIAARLKQDPESPNTCDCGEWKSPLFVCCDRCAFLDGLSQHGSHRASVIAVLRIAGDALTLTEIAREVYGREIGKNNERRQMDRVVRQLVDQGRVRRIWDESVSLEIANAFGERDVKSTTGAWRYTLAVDSWLFSSGGAS